MGKTIKGYIQKTSSCAVAQRELITESLKAHRKSEELCRKREEETRQHLAKYLLSRRKHMRQRLIELTSLREEELAVAFEQRVNNTINEELSRMEEECLAIALQLTEEIVQHEVTFNTQSLRAKIQHALSEMNYSKNITVHVHKQDASHLKMLQNNSHIQLQENQEIAQGCARLVSENGSVTINWRDELAMKQRDLKELLHDLQSEEQL